MDEKLFYLCRALTKLISQDLIHQKLIPTLQHIMAPNLSKDSKAGFFLEVYPIIRNLEFARST